MKENKIFEFAMKHPIVTLFIASDICGMLTKCVAILRTGQYPVYSEATSTTQTTEEAEGSVE